MARNRSSSGGGRSSVPGGNALGHLFQGFGNDMRTQGADRSDQDPNKPKFNRSHQQGDRGNGRDRDRGINSLGPANNPLQGIIQGLTFRNPLVQGSNDAANYKPKAPEIFPGINIGAGVSGSPRSRPNVVGANVPQMQPEASNSMRNLIYALMQRNIREDPDRYR